jgi:transcriptional regulator with XRE-family HTH domain
MSNELQHLLKEYFERSAYGSINALAEATDRQVSKSYISHLLRGIRKNPAYDKLLAIARALELNPGESNQLLSAAGYPPLPGQNPDIERAMTALDRLQQTPGISEQAIKTIVDGLVTMIEGVKIGVGAGSLPAAPSRPPAELPLTPDEGLIDDLLGEMLASESGHPLENLFATLKEAARQGRWEAKRRLAEALPRLVQSHPDGTLQLAEILRNDYHPDYRADIRRRVIPPPGDRGLAGVIRLPAGTGSPTICLSRRG